MQACKTIPGKRRADCGFASGIVGRFIGATLLLLLAGSSAFGQFVVQPMKVEAAAPPNRKFPTSLAIENLNSVALEQVDLRLVDITQTDDGVWEVVEPDDPTVKALERTCIDWITLEEESIDLAPLERKVLNMWVRVPVGKRGYYCAGIMASTRPRAEVIDGMTTNLVFRFLIPIIIEVQGRPMRNEISLLDTGLAFRPRTEIASAATLVTMKVENTGGTYARLMGINRVWAKQGGHWRKIGTLEFPERSILPGAAFTLTQDVGRPLPAGQYRVQGYLYVDGRRADQFVSEFEFGGDDRMRQATGGSVGPAIDAVLSLDPPELTLTAVPGAMRQERVTIINSSEESVQVDIETTIPKKMVGMAVQLPNGMSIRGEELACASWLQVEPKQFTLPGYGRKNVRVIAEMPGIGSPFPNYYADLKLHASYPDGQLAGTAEGSIFVQTYGTQAEARVEKGTFAVHESAPGRYIVTARFSNMGVTHVMPRCHGRLLLASDDSIRKRFAMNESYDESGKLLPFESRPFTGILDVSDVGEGLYRLVAILEHDKGNPVFSQQAIQIRNENGTMSVEVVGLDAIGGETVIEL